MNKIFHNSQSGFGLVHVMALSALLIAVGAGTMQVMDQRLEHMKVVRIGNRLDMLQKRVEYAATSQQSMQNSAKYPSNKFSDFGKCMTGGTCRPDPRPDDFTLLNANNDLVTGYYLFNGEDCQEVNKRDCPIQVETKYQVFCPNNASVCSQAERIEVSYTISQINTKVSKGFQFSPRTGKVTLAAFICPDDEVVQGVRADGELMCGQPRRTLYETDCKNDAAIGINADGTLLCKPIRNFCAKDLSLVLVIDASGSMSGAKIQQARESAESFVDKLRMKDDVGVVYYSNKASKMGPMAHDFGTVKGKIRGLGAGGSTNMTDGLYQARELLNGAPPESVKIILFMSDGWHNVGTGPLGIAKELRDAAIPVWSIGFGNSADEVMLRNIASSPANYLYAKAPKDLQGVYDAISKTLCRDLGG